jgi:hypothetical protein
MLGDLSDIETDDCVVLVKLDTPEVLAMVVDEKWYNQTVLGEEMKLFSLELTFDHETEAEKKVEKKVGYLRIVFDGKVQLAHIAIHADINAPPTDE